MLANSFDWSLKLWSTGSKRCPRIDRDRYQSVAYNLLWRPIEVEIQPTCLTNNIGLICYWPLVQGLLTGRYESPDDVPDGRSRSRLFTNDRALANHGENGCEAEAFDAIAHRCRRSVVGRYRTNQGQARSKRRHVERKQSNALTFKRQ